MFRQWNSSFGCPVYFALSASMYCHKSSHQSIHHQSITATLVEAMVICYTLDCITGISCNTDTITPLTHQSPGLHCSPSEKIKTNQTKPFQNRGMSHAFQNENLFFGLSSGTFIQWAGSVAIQKKPT